MMGSESPLAAAGRCNPSIGLTWIKAPPSILSERISSTRSCGRSCPTGSLMLHGWDNFFIMAGTAAATLTALLFVVITLGVQMSAARAAHGVHAFVTPTLV